MSALKDTLVTILIPVYNGEEFLERAVRSACEQTYSHIEILIVDDGSTDGTSILGDNFAKKDERIKVVHKSHENTLQARKTGVYNAKGEYVLNLDSDDYLAPDAVEFLLSKALLYEADIVTSACYVEKDNTQIINRDHIPEGVYGSEDEKEFLFKNLIFMNSCLKYGIMDSIWGKLIRKKLLIDFYYPVKECLRFGEDDAVVYSSFRDAGKICVTYKPIYYHVMRDNSVSQSIYMDFFKDISDMRRLLLDYYKGNKYYKYIKKQTDIAFIKLCFWGIKSVINIEPDIIIHDYIIPDYDINGGRIIIYGSGKVGKAFYKSFMSNKNYKVVSWIDKKFSRYNQFTGVDKVKDVIILKDKTINFDYIIIAVLDEELAKNIKNELEKKYGIHHKKILWKKPEHIVDKNINWENLYGDNENDS